MRRSLAPSQKCNVSNCDALRFKRRKSTAAENECLSTDISSKIASQTQNDNQTDACEAALSAHEALIRRILSRPFRLPLANYTGARLSDRCLGVRRSGPPQPLHDPFAPDALVLYEPPTLSAHAQLKSGGTAGGTAPHVHVVVDPALSRVLRPHQRHGVRFLYECVIGRRVSGHAGCIMADEMGLGKTLQCITLMWTLLQQSPVAGRPDIDTAVVVAPSSLVRNWAAELEKWLAGRCRVLVVDGSGRQDTSQRLSAFVARAPVVSNSDEGAGDEEKMSLLTRRRRNHSDDLVMIISYETLRIHATSLAGRRLGLLICDEGHRLKNCESQTYTALAALHCRRRVLISGTPIQNDLLEYFSLVHFVNPQLLGSAGEFRRRFETPILRARDRDASEKQRSLGAERLRMLLDAVSGCIIRRTASLLSQYLPVKRELIVCCRMTPLQCRLYDAVLRSDLVRRCISSDSHQTTAKAGVAGGGRKSALVAITALKKICNHPLLVYDHQRSTDDPLFCLQQAFTSTAGDVSFDGAARKGGAGSATANVRPELSGKVSVLDCLLALIRARSDDRVVLVSNYTQTLDLLERMCRLRSYPYVRLDGSMSIKQRAKIVSQFNCVDSQSFIFMLSSKAGGCGLNLIGANRLVMFDPDWNPANDEQAMARVWRDGQRKPCFVYRMLAVGGIEEKMFQRQTLKKALSACVVDAKDAGKEGTAGGGDVEGLFSGAELRELFVERSGDDEGSDTHTKMKCRRCVNGVQCRAPDEDATCASDLSQWHHCKAANRQLPDEMLRACWTAGVSFVFHQRSHERTPTESSITAAVAADTTPE